jgi:hypothetical protein
LPEKNTGKSKQGTIDMSKIPPVLSLLPPETLPHSYDEIRRQCTPEVYEALHLSLSGISTLSGIETLARIKAALRALPEPVQAKDFKQLNKPSADKDSHDEYCRIKRVYEDASLNIYIHAILRAYEEFVEDSISGSSSLTDRQWHQLRGAFDSVLRFLIGDLEIERLWQDELPEKSLWRHEQPCDPLARWLRGHHVFLVLIQCVITSLNCFFNAYKTRELELSTFALDLTTKLFDGCSVALHFAGDFSPIVYEASVRPTMMPPQVPPGMSGVLARDHEYLVRLLRTQKQVFKTLDPVTKQQYMRLVSAFENTYESHKLVCSHFVGDEGPSLLNRDEQAEAAVDVLDKVKHIRLRSFHEHVGQ